MKCPHCAIHFHENWYAEHFERTGRLLAEPTENENIYWFYRSAICPKCKHPTIEVARKFSNDEFYDGWRQIFPIGSNRGPVPIEVPGDIASDYIEACNVLPISPKASAALARRCLQAMLHSNGYRDQD